MATVAQKSATLDDLHRRRGEMAEAKPAVPGWSVLVDWILS